MAPATPDVGLLPAVGGRLLSGGQEKGRGGGLGGGGDGSSIKKKSF